MEVRRVTAGLAASISTTSLLSSRLLYSLPAPSAWQNSGLPPSGNVATTSPVLALRTEESLDRPLKVNTRCVLGS